MRPTSLEDIRRQVHGRWLTAPAGSPPSITRLTIDTRQARAGDLFLAIRGDRLDGHDFLAQAAAAGCAAAIVQADRSPAPAGLADFAGVIGVADTKEALAALARTHRRRLTGRVIAVTGSVGKTTVKGMIHHILSRQWKGSAAIKSFNNNIGVPLTLLAADESDDYVVCELGSNAPGEIAALADIAEPDVAVITTVGASHLEKLGSVERVAAEKAAILGPAARRHGVGIIRDSLEPLEQAVRGCGVRLIRFGEGDQADLRLTGWEGRGLTQRFQVNGRSWFTLPLPGRHNAFNALAAIAVAVSLGWELEQAGGALADVQGPDMRLQVRRAGDVTVVNDAYNANPVSMAAALEVLGGLEGRRRVFVAGDMRELGETSPALHRALGRQVAAAGIDLLVTVGSLGALIGQAALEADGAAPAVLSYPTAAEAAAHVEDWLAPGDTVLVKASRGVAAECIVERLAARPAAPAVATGGA